MNQSTLSDRQIALQHEICEAFDIDDQERLELLKALWVHRYGFHTLLKDEEMKSILREKQESLSNKDLSDETYLRNDWEDQKTVSESQKETEENNFEKPNEFEKVNKQEIISERTQDVFSPDLVPIEEEKTDIKDLIDEGFSDLDENFTQTEFNTDQGDRFESVTTIKPEQSDYIEEDIQSENSFNSKEEDQDNESDDKTVDPKNIAPPPPPPSINEFRRWLN